MENIKVMAVVPYEGLFELMKEVAQELVDIRLDIELGNLHEGVAIAKEAEKRGYQIIISRGGTASMIQEAVSIPVIDIQVSGYDVLRILTLVKGFSRKAAIVGFTNVTQGAVTISKLLDFDIKTITITSEIEVKEKLIHLQQLGYEVVIGDVITVRAAKELGLTGVLITSGKEAIIDALDEARRSYRLFFRLQQDVAFFQSILDQNEQAIGVMNNDYKMIYGNKRLNKEFQRVKLETSANIKKLIEETNIIRKKITKVLYLNDSFWKVTVNPNADYMILIFENHLSNKVNDVVEENHDEIEVHTSIPFVPIAGKSTLIQQVINQIDEYSEKDESVWISGEKGIGKTLVAQSIYFKRKPVNSPFIILHCDILSEELLKEIMEESFVHNHTNGVIFLRNIDRLNPYMQKALYRLLKDDLYMKRKWIVSSTDSMEEKIKNGHFHPELYQILAQLKIHIPPLRERRQDIEDLVQVFISELHPKYGNGVVGIRQEALEELISFDWPGNVRQLKQAIEQLFLQSQTYYIEKDDAVKILRHLEEQTKKDGTLTQIDISGTLAEIEKQIIHKVLEEEGSNQSKAAKRLGINRSTLWRKLK